MQRNWFAAIALAAIVVATPGRASAQQVVAADDFVDTVGVNIHLHYEGTAYRDNFPLIKKRLIELGVRHVRDGLVDTTWRPYYDRHNELGAAGIKGTFITSPQQATDVWTSYPARVAQSFEAFEGPNEYDQSRDPNWARTLTQAMIRLRTIRNDPRVGHFPIYGPSLTTEGAYVALGDVSAYFDFANLHNYFAGRHPATRGWGANGYGSLAWHLRLSSRYAAGRPIVSTETGYQDGPSIIDSVPQDVVGRYMPMLLLEQFRVGITRTFIYELADFARSGSYGLLNSDGSPKPSFNAVRNLLGLFADPGPPFTPRDVRYTVATSDVDLRHQAFQKRDGTYLIALWLSRPVYDPATRARTTVAAQDVVVTLPAPLRHVRTHRWQADGAVAVTAITPPAAASQVSLADSLVVMEVR